VKALALDFDGVIVDSSHEVHVVALRAYLALQPRSRLRRFLGPVGPSSDPSTHDFRNDPLFEGFTRLVPLGNRAEDFGAALRSLEEGAELPDQAAYDAYFAALDSIWLDAYHREFYRQRCALRDSSAEVWTRLHGIYPGLGATLRRLESRWALWIATAKDHASVRLLLDHYDLGDLFPDGAVLDKETGRTKRAHLQLIQRRVGVPFADITFVDDKVNHLERVAGLGVRPVLAGWGHNTPREHDRARALGFPVATLDRFGQIVEADA